MIAQTRQKRTLHRERRSSYPMSGRRGAEDALHELDTYARQGGVSIALVLKYSFTSSSLTPFSTLTILAGAVR
jgi:hypothetical protein